jgi:hypothetical protein
MPHKYAGLRVSEILRLKKGSVRQAPLPDGSPSWSEFEGMMWEEIEEGARQNLPGFKTVRKLLSDQRFDR